MVTFQTGFAAEDNVAKLLVSRKFKILARNWRQPRCEIDIIAKKDNVVYFVEVKYRSNSEYGDGLDYITAKKQKQLLYGARLWCQKNNFSGDWRLLAASVSGVEFSKIIIVEI